LNSRYVYILLVQRSTQSDIFLSDQLNYFNKCQQCLSVYMCVSGSFCRASE